MVKLYLDTKGDNIYIDTRYSVTLINKSKLLLELLDIYITKMSISLKVRGVGTSKYKTLEYVIISIYFLGVNNKNNSLFLVYFCKKLYLIDSLRAKILIGNNIISLEGIVINLI